MEPVVAVKRDRDELTSFISVSPEPEPEPVVDETVAVSMPTSDSAKGVSVASDEVASSPDPVVAEAAPEPSPEPEPAPDPEPAPVEPKTEPVGGDSDETLMLEVPPEPEEPAGQEATLFFEVPRIAVGKLVVIKGELKGEEFEIREGDNQIGRSPECDVVLASMWISRVHAVLRCQMGRLEIESMSDKVTSVDGEPVSGAVVVAAGAKIQLGGTVCRVELEG